MKYFILTLFLLMASVVPAMADESAMAPWGFLYEFHLRLDNNSVVVSRPFTISSGEVPELVAGLWKLIIRSANGEVLNEYSFDPAKNADRGTLTLLVPMKSRGASAEFVNPSGKVSETIDISDSRVCNDDGICMSDAGETAQNCQTDCGVSASQPMQPLTAAIVDVAPLSQRVGSALMKLAAGVAGVMLLVGVVEMLDKRRWS